MYVFMRNNKNYPLKLSSYTFLIYFTEVLYKGRQCYHKSSFFKNSISLQLSVAIFPAKITVSQHASHFLFSFLTISLQDAILVFQARLNVDVSIFRTCVAYAEKLKYVHLIQPIGLLTHLSQRLIGELIVQAGIRPSIINIFK